MAVSRIITTFAHDVTNASTNHKITHMEKTLVLIKPCGVERQLVGEVINRFERRGLILRGIKMLQMTDELIDIHYAHLREKSFFEGLKESMQYTPVIAMCWEGKEAVKVVRDMTGYTNGRKAVSGTIRGDFSVSSQQNIVHSSDSIDSARIELERFFRPEEIFTYNVPWRQFYASDEID